MLERGREAADDTEEEEEEEAAEALETVEAAGDTQDVDSAGSEKRRCSDGADSAADEDADDEAEVEAYGPKDGDMTEEEQTDCGDEDGQLKQLDEVGDTA